MNPRLNRWLTLGALLLAAPLLTGFNWPWCRPKPKGPPLEIPELRLAGRIAGENATFTLAFTATVHQKDAVLPLASGATGRLGGDWPEHVKLLRAGDGYQLRFTRTGTVPVRFEFASRTPPPAGAEAERLATFTIPAATVRRVAITCDRPDLNVRIAGAADLRQEERAGADGRKEQVISALLPPGQPFLMRWKPEVRRLDGELMLSCDANTVATAKVGALQVDTLLQYRIAQGALQQVELGLPAQLQVTQVRGADIREWSIQAPAKGAAGERRLTVQLNRPQEGQWQLQVEGELSLPAFPAKAELPFVAPKGVIRASGFLLLGADSAIKLQVTKAAGLTQIDQGAFPRAALGLPDTPPRPLPARGLYAYQYANLPCQLEVTAEDIVTGLFVEDRLVLSLENNALALAAVTELDIRDAPAREVVLEVAPDWTVANVAGARLADHDVRDREGRRFLHLHFREALSGRNLVEVRLEKALGEGAAAFAAPLYRVQGAKAERGWLICRAEQGIRLKAEAVANLREVQPGSLPTRVPGAQSAYRFKEPAWSARFLVEQAAPSIHAELFHLLSVGEGAVFGSCSVTYNIGSAPVRGFRLRVPAGCQNVEFTGRDIRNWRQEGEEYAVFLQDKVAGDYTLLVTWDQPLPAAGEVALGGIRTLDTESTTGYLVLAGPATIAVDRELGRDKAVLPLANAELPPAYVLLVNDPLLTCYKFVSQKAEPHAVQLAVKRHPTLPSLPQVADHQALATRLSDEGEAVTTATYFVKNSTGQYFRVTLPPGARLWSAAIDGRAVQALDDGHGVVLVPLERRPDPNLAAAITLVYAEQHGRVGWRHRLGFTAPASDAKSVFARWTFQAPAACSLAPAAGGNMLPEQEPAESRLVALAGVVRARLAAAWPLLLLLLAPLAPAALAVFNAKRGRPFHWSGILLVLAGLAALLLLGPPLLDDAATTTAAAPPAELLRHLSLTKPVTLADSRLAVELAVTADWFVWIGKGLTAAAAAAAGVFLLRRARQRARLLAGAGLTLLLWALAGFRPLLPLLAWLLLLAPLAALWAAGLRRAAAAGTARRPPPEPEEPEPAAAPRAESATPAPAAAPGGANGLALLLLTGTLLAASANSAPAAEAAAAALPPATAAPVMTDIRLTVAAPDVTRRDAKAARDAKARLELAFEGRAGQRFPLLEKPHVVESYTLDSKRLHLTVGDGTYTLEVNRKGDATAALEFLVPVTEIPGGWRLALPLPANLRNRVEVTLPGTGWEVAAPAAAWLEVKEEAGATRCQMVAGPEATLAVEWRPRARTTRLERAEFIAETKTLALFQPGVVGLTHEVRYQIARGEVQALALAVPAGMNVTAVAGSGVGAWRFDPESRQLEVLLATPASGEYLLTVVTLLPREGLPYTAALAPLEVRGAGRQRGALAVAATEAVQLRIGEPAGFSGMNVGDFTPLAAALAPRERPLPDAAAEIKRAFRYQQLPATVPVTAEKVLPELRVAEAAQVDVSDERVTLSTTLGLTIAKAGLFSVRLDLPPQFDVESLTGDEISHWDEVKEDGHGVIVHFTRQALGTRRLNLVASRLEKGVPPELTLPKATVRDAFRQTGTVVLSGERGVRFAAETREGVSELNPRELGLEQAGTLAFKLLRPDWRVVLKTEALAPVVKSEVLQRIDLSEGMLAVRGYVLYAIEHAGVKLFRLQAPAPEAALTVTGRNLARVQKVDAAKGIWEVELTAKVEKEYRLEVACQLPYEHQRRDVAVAPLRTLDVEAEKLSLAIFAGGRLQVRPGALPEGMAAEDPRSLPTRFNAGNLSGAVLCFRTARPEAALPLDVVRHGTAEVLPAKVSRVRLASVVANDFQMVTRAELALEVNSLRFLEVALPAGGELWSAFVNGKGTTPLAERGAYLIPLDPATPQANVELIFSGAAASVAHAGRRLGFAGPRFNLPLADVEWTFFLPPHLHYYAVDGTLRRRFGAREETVVFSTERYSDANRAVAATSLRQAEAVLEKGAQYFQAGRQLEARQALQAAVALSQGQQDLNEDARIQFRNVARQQAVVGLVNRRTQMKIERNRADEAAVRLNLGFNEGKFDADYSRRLEQSLGAEEQSSLSKVAEKILDQQAAAAAELNPIRITLPEQGVRLTVFRELQIQAAAPMELRLKAFGDRATRLLAPAAAAAGLTALLWLTATLALARRGTPAPQDSTP
ncbi:MAG: hypothetical protein WC789_00835 [Lentisphaeria bacterium]|jgi:hypothetical protein